VPQLPSPPPPAIAPSASFVAQPAATRSRNVSGASSQQRPHTSHRTQDNLAAWEKEAVQRAAKKEQRILWEAEEDMRREKQAQDEKARKQMEWEIEQLKLAEDDGAQLRAAKSSTEAERQRTWGSIGRTAAKNIVAQKAPPTPSQPEHPSRSGIFGRFGMSSPKPVERPRTTSREAPPEEKPTIKAGGGGVVPGTDAPVSAVNHGDRRVRVHTQGTSILLPIKPDTTPLQLIRASVTFFAAPIDPRNSLLLERFTKGGLQRSLRMYEQIRNILNSWDSDDQHELILEPYDASNDKMLYAHSAPSSKPSSKSWTMYVSQRRGKWDKKYITLSSDGLITAAKNDTGKDTMNICNMSDFEIFAPTKDGEKRRYKPPKKFCYAIKSMQKSSVFLGDTGFIHMFCSSDQRIAQSFHDAVFRWRSWYLVNVMGDGGQPRKNRVHENALATASMPFLPSGSHRRGASQESAYILGTFKNSLDFDPTTFAVAQEMPARASHRRLPSDVPLAAAIAPPVLTAEGMPSPLEHSKAVLARQMSMRRAAAQAGPTAAHHRAGSTAAAGHHIAIAPAPAPAPAPAAGPPFAANIGLQRNVSVRSNARSSLDHGAPFPGRPLIDLTPQYVEPPQHQRKGRGFRPAQVGSGGLVECATGPEAAPGAIVIPESREWRRRPSAAAARPPATAGGLGRNESVRGGGGPGNGLMGDLGLNQGFTGGGLLAGVGSERQGSRP
jgi:hypothetical protein